MMVSRVDPLYRCPEYRYYPVGFSKYFTCLEFYTTFEAQKSNFKKLGRLLSNICSVMKVLFGV